MKPLCLSIVFATILFSFSCKHTTQQKDQPKKKETPKALQEDNGGFSLIKKSMGRDNLMDVIYANLVDSNADLKKLEDRREHFNSGYADSLKEFNEYDSKSNSYYSSANEILTQVKDSVLRQRLRVLLTTSRKEYDNKVSDIRTTIHNSESDQSVASDYHQALKIAVTLPVIERYQANNEPDKKTITAIAAESKNLKQNTRQLEEKYLAKSVNK